MLLTRLVALGLALIEAVLALRLLFPFMRIPPSLEGYVPTLVDVSDWLIAPFRVFVQPFTLDQLDRLPGGELGYASYLDKVDTTVLVAMVGWAIAGSLALFILRAVVRVR
ncbi:MAG: hypothetical protein KF809_09445 [Chloroflexi bacterium]|nr:hypothetical protein [Chloroflexota bacterium]